MSGRFNVSSDAATALRLILVTAARPGMVRGMVGTELRDLSGPSDMGGIVAAGPADESWQRIHHTTLGLGPWLLRPHLKADANAPLFDLHPNDLYEAAHRIVPHSA